ncbi:MAG: thermonuclease family protein [Microthrixaceae bacterium]
MIGFDTPESVDPRRPVQCYGKEASRHLATLIPPRSRVRLERDTEREDRYGRTLAYVFRASDGLFVNVQMVLDGYAHTLTVPPNVSYTARFADAARQARAAGRGLWSACPLEQS